MFVHRIMRLVGSLRRSLTLPEEDACARRGNDHRAPVHVLWTPAVPIKLHVIIEHNVRKHRLKLRRREEPSWATAPSTHQQARRAHKRERHPPCMFAVAERDVVSRGIDILVFGTLSFGVPLTCEAERVKYVRVVVESFVAMHRRCGGGEKSASRDVSSIAENNILLGFAHDGDCTRIASECMMVWQVWCTDSC